MATFKAKAETPETILVHTNIVDITTKPSTDLTPAYIVDARLLDDLLSKITNGSLYEIKSDLKSIIDKASDKDKMFVQLDDYIYMNTVVQKLTAVQESIGKAALIDDSQTVEANATTVVNDKSYNSERPY